MRWFAKRPVSAALALIGLVLGMARAMPASATTMVEEIKTPKGFTLWYVREATIPVISLQLHFKGGAALDPAGKNGLARFASSLFDEGAGDLDSQTFQRRITNLAIGLKFDAGLDSFSVDLQTLTENREEAFQLAGLALSSPRFDQDAVERVRAQFLHIIREGEQDPAKRSAQGWFRAAFGDHPYAAPSDGTKASITSITIDDLKVFARDRLARDNVVIGASGDVSSDEIARLVDLVLGKLPEKAVAATLPDVALPAAGLMRIEQLDVPQSVVSFGLNGFKRDNPDFYAAYVMNHVLGGGGFTSRLYAEVREKRGLAYSVYSYLQPMRAAGLFMGGVATQNDRVAESIALIRAEIARMAKDGVTEAELAAAKRHLTGAFPLNFDTGDQIADMLVGMQVDRLGIDYFVKRNAYLNAVTVADVARVAKQLLDPEKLVIVVAGNPVGLVATP